MESVSDEAIEAAIREILSPFSKEILDQWSSKRVREHLQTAIFPNQVIEKSRVKACINNLVANVPDVTPLPPPLPPPLLPVPAEPVVKKRKLQKLSECDDKEDKEENTFDLMMKTGGEEPVNYGVKKKKKPKKEKGKDSKDSKQNNTKKKKKRKVGVRRFIEDEASGDEDDEDDEEGEDEETAADRAFIADDSPKKSKSGHYDMASESKLFQEEDTGWYNKFDLERKWDQEETLKKIERQAIRMEMIRESEQQRIEEQAEEVVVDPDKTDSIFLGIVGSYFLPGAKQRPYLENLDFKLLLEQVKSNITGSWGLPEDKVILVTGGMGGGDHIAVRLFLEGKFKGLQVNLPCEWEDALKGIRGKENGQTGTDIASNPGRAFNISHVLLNAKLKHTYSQFLVEDKSPTQKTMSGQQNLQQMFAKQLAKRSLLSVEELQLAYSRQAMFNAETTKSRTEILQHCQYIITLGMPDSERKPFLVNFKGKQMHL